MRSWTLILGASFALVVAAPVVAKDALEGAPPSETAATEAAATAAPEEPAAEEPAQKPAERGPVTLGPVGYDDQGRQGRIHDVVTGDTLWDVSDAYLGTPWVWPSIWRDNSDIQNPHLIHPGDKLWISPHEMRRITDAEAANLLGGSSPAALADGMDDGQRPDRYRFSEMQTAGFVTRGVLDGSAVILDSVVDRVWLGDHDTVIVGMGAGETEVGAQYEIIRKSSPVKDPETGFHLGWATIVLGWLEVQAVEGESSTAMIRLSRGEIRRGDHLLPRPSVEIDFDVASKPAVEGSIMHTPNYRFEMGSSDVVYLNRGAGDGLQVGSPLEVFRAIGTAPDEIHNRQRQLPDAVIAKLIVVSTTPDTATAVITHTSTDIQRGDRFRGADSLW